MMSLLKRPFKIIEKIGDLGPADGDVNVNIENIQDGLRVTFQAINFKRVIDIKISEKEKLEFGGEW